MRQKWAVFALTALLTLGMTGCASGNNATVDNMWPNDDRNMPGERIIDGVQDAVDDAGDMLTGDADRYREMLENGRVHDSDGYLWDGENRHD